MRRAPGRELGVPATSSTMSAALADRARSSRYARCDSQDRPGLRHRTARSNARIAKRSVIPAMWSTTRRRVAGICHAPRSRARCSSARTASRTHDGRALGLVAPPARGRPSSNMNARSAQHRARPRASPWTMSPAASECSTRSCTSMSIRSRAGLAEQLRSRRAGRSLRLQHAGAHGVVDVVVDVGDPVDEPHDPALERRGRARARVVQDAVAHLVGEVQAAARRARDARRRAASARCGGNRGRSARASAVVERLLAGVAERRVAEVVAEPDRLGQVLVQPRARAPPCARCPQASSVCVSRVR